MLSKNDACALRLGDSKQSARGRLLRNRPKLTGLNPFALIIHVMLLSGQHEMIDFVVLEVFDKFIFNMYCCVLYIYLLLIMRYLAHLLLSWFLCLLRSFLMLGIFAHEGLIAC